MSQFGTFPSAEKPSSATPLGEQVGWIPWIALTKFGDHAAFSIHVPWEAPSVPCRALLRSRAKISLCVPEGP